MLNLIKNHVFDILSWLPGIILTARRSGDQGDPVLRGINWHQVGATLIIMLLTAISTSYLTSRDNASEIKHLNATISEFKLEMRTQVGSICGEVGNLKQNIAVIKTLQDERIAHERSLGLRR
jgi:hypothetical protein